MAKENEQGTGKHPHKSTEEPYPHHEGKSESGGKAQAAGASSGGHSSGSRGSESGRENEGGSESSNLKSREYTDAQGNVHHHTDTYEEQHKNK